MTVTRRADLLRAAALSVIVLCAWVALDLPHLRAWSVRSDTAALLLHSTRFYPTSALDWLRRGFSDYFVVYPEATVPATSFVRPLVNASFWLESLFAPSPQSALFFTTNLLGHAAVVALTYLAARRVARVTPARAALAALLFGGSTSVLELMQYPAFRADMLATLFALSALLLLVRRDDPAGDAATDSRVAMAALLFTCSLLAKETGILAPVLGAWLLRRRASRAVLVAALPWGVFLALRVMLPSHGVYVHPVQLPSRVIQVLGSAFFPAAGPWQLRAMLRGQAPWALLPIMAVAANVAGWLLVARSARSRDRATIELGAAVIVLLAVPMVLAPEPRFMYLAQSIALPLLVMVMPSPNGAARRWLVMACWLVAILAGPVATVSAWQRDLPEALQRDADAHLLRDALAEELRDMTVHRVYVLNDRVGDYGGGALLEMARLDARRRDVRLRMVNGLSIEAPGNRRGLSLEERGTSLFASLNCAGPCGLGFAGIEAGAERRLSTPGLHYESVASDAFRVEILDWATADVTLLGWDPGDGRLFRNRATRLP
ncbi:MAG: hypothetical protein JWO05_2074 [Gemmatimonadetes bacterium]|nr:hypothetical protein [Gemmatimonadota bacterium]